MTFNSSNIFAGPIVRSVSPKEVYIWVASINIPQVSAKLFINGNVIAEGISQSIMINDQANANQKIFINLIKITPINGNFPSNQPISYALGVMKNGKYDYEDFYDIVLTDYLAYANEEWYDVQKRVEKILKAERPNLPSFIIPTDSTILNIAFGSCRKPHDNGEDAFVKLDNYIKSYHKSIHKRPHVLYLGGDQIYADDVDDRVIYAINHLNAKYSLYETLPSTKTPTHLINDRTDVVKKMNFTSTEIKNHLLSFPEYCMMYGLVWNLENWKDIRPHKDIPDFTQGLKATRRVLANTATYMIFDDHDVTDDWNITNNQKDKVKNNNNGKRVIANALAAYFLFQGWGNAPNEFDYIEIKKIIENRNQDYKTYDDSFLDLNWEFQVKTKPESYFLDTRTRRGGTDFPPLLKESWSNTKITITNKNLPFVLISPGPMVTFPGIDSLQELAVNNANMHYALDYESWFANKENYVMFYNYFKSQNVSKIIVLSGDVHYGFSAIFSLYNKEHILAKPGAFKINCLQITSSAFKNSAKLPLGISLGVFSSVPEPSTGKCYFLFFNNNFSKALELKSTNHYVPSNSKIDDPFPDYAFISNKIHKKNLKYNVVLGGFEVIYYMLDESEYPFLTLELIIKSKSPLTADYLAEHNYGLVQIQQNQIKYAFNNKTWYQHSM